MLLKETTLYTCPRENFSRIITVDHVHLDLEMCKIQEIRMSRERAGDRGGGEKEVEKLRK